MKTRIIRLSELVQYHQIKEVYNGCIACFTIDEHLVNIDTVPPVFADMFSFVAVRKGSAVFSLNNRSKRVDEGHLLLLYPSLLVSLISQSSDFEAIHLLCERSFFERMLASRKNYQTYSLFYCSGEYPILALAVEQMENLCDIMEQIRYSILHSGSYQEDIMQHLLHVFLLRVLGLIESDKMISSSGIKHGDMLFQQFISLVTQYYKEEHELAFYAHKLSVSTTYLSRIIRNSTQKTAGYFLTGLLYAEACRLLLNTDRTVQSIADELCFSDQSAFGKFFKAHSGFSPQNYRRNALFTAK